MYDNDNNLNSNEDVVFKKWSEDFQTLYDNSSVINEFDEQFYENIVREKDFLEGHTLDPLYEENLFLNRIISLEEVESVVMAAKSGKSVGIDKIPYEVLKFPVVISLLHSLFNLCLDTGIVPTAWKKAIISPIPKDTSKDKRIPLNYRGISLISVVSKLYSNVLNIRLMKYLENENIFAEEQNGFRPHRSCEEHIFSATTLIRNRILQKIYTFATFIDLQKAFDFVNRGMLLFIMIKNGINGKFYSSFKSLITNTQLCVKLNGILSDWFPTISGVRQGDTSSSTVFALYINDLIEGINGLGKGIKYGNNQLSCLVYADDIILLSESENDMQTMLDFTNDWYNKWRLHINHSNCMHFRNKEKSRSKYLFKVKGYVLEYTDTYK